MGICKISDCNNSVKIKGFCSLHYTQYIRGYLDIKGHEVKKRTCFVAGCKNTKTAHNGLCWKHYRELLQGKKLDYWFTLPRKWDSWDFEDQKKYLDDVRNVDYLKYILFKSKYLATKNLCIDRLKKFKVIIKKKSIGCKIKGCHGKPNNQNNFVKGFCNKHHQQYVDGIIDINGKQIRPLVPRNERNKKRVKKQSKTMQEIIVKDLNKIIREIHKLRINLKDLKDKTLFDGHIDHELVHQISYMDDNLRFIYSPKFLVNMVSYMENQTVKRLLNGEQDEPIPVYLEMKTNKKERKFQGTLIKGGDGNIVLTQYEIINKKEKKSELALYLKDKIDKFPFECRALDVAGNVIGNIVMAGKND